MQEDCLIMSVMFLAMALTRYFSSARPQFHENTLTYSQRAHAVNIVGPITVSEGNLISVTAEPVHFLNPVFQFWIELPGGSYESSGPYSAHTHFTFTATSLGTFHIKVFAREANAPSNENLSQRRLYEVVSSSIPVKITPTTHYPIQLTANEPLVRSGQAITLTASMSNPTPIGDFFELVDTTTGQIVYRTNDVNTFSYRQTFNDSQRFVAEVVNSPSPGSSPLMESEPLIIDWSTKPIGTNQGHANQAGQTVSISYPAAATVGTPVTLTAVPKGFQHPVYQFWILPPNGSYESSGSYQSSPTFTFTPTIPGSWQVMVYARPQSAPSHETPAQQAVYEAKSNTHFVTVTSP